MRSKPISWSAQRKGSLATRLAFGTVLLVVCVTSLTVFELTRREWDRLVESKLLAVDMAANLFAGSIAAALDFGDVDAVKTGLDGLRSNSEIIYAAVFAGTDAKALATYEATGRHSAPPEKAREGEQIEVSSAVRSPTGTHLGSVLIRVSLTREEQAFRRTRVNLIGFGALFAAALASLLVVVMRRVLVVPLGRLQAAAMQLAEGERVVVPADRDDELGSLSHAFNSMAASIDERERRIANQNRRLQALLDNMGQAIVVFGADGLLTEERSRSAERWLDARPGNSLLDILYPEDDALDIERQAFEAWLEVVFSSPAEKFRELLELAPQVLTRQIGSAEMHFELAFRLAGQAGPARQLMLLATDVTEQRRLERSVLEKEREHERQLSALRRLATGGGQLFVGFLENTRRRLEACRELVLAGSGVTGDPGGLDRMAVEALYQQLHTVRAEARCFDLARLESDIEGLENELQRMREQGYVTQGADQSRLSRGLLELSTLVDDAERSFVQQSPLGALALDQITVRRSRLLALAGATEARTDRIARLVDELCSRPLVESLALLPEAVERWAERAGKKVHLEIDHAGLDIPFSLSRVLGGVLSHLLRNAIAHGIESEPERLEQGKPGIGRVRLWGESTLGGPSIGIGDDGRGFDLQGLEQRVGSLGASEASAFAAALQPGVSTSSRRDELSGAGVGLAAAVHELASVGYQIQLVSTSAQGTSLKLTPFPRRDGRVQERHVG